jgi:hypothetical protein
LRYSVEVKFNSSGRIRVNGNEIIISIKSEPKHGKANREMIKKMSEFQRDANADDMSDYFDFTKPLGPPKAVSVPD